MNIFNTLFLTLFEISAQNGALKSIKKNLFKKRKSQKTLKKNKPRKQ
jgi:hypothetical protein